MDFGHKLQKISGNPGLRKVQGKVQPSHYLILTHYMKGENLIVVNFFFSRLSVTDRNIFEISKKLSFFSENV